MQRIRAVGYGVPDLNRALASRGDALTLVAEASLTPYEGEATKEMHLHALPWPRQALLDLSGTPVALRVTLSYFVEPNPARRGYTGKHPYPSHQLGFDLNNPAESVAEFRKRINFKENPENRGAREAKGWMLGAKHRAAGSIHVDWWEGDAADLATRSHLAVYPTKGWWRTKRRKEGEAPRVARYALVVSIEAPPGAADLYTPVAAMTDAVRPLAVPTVAEIAPGG